MKFFTALLILMSFSAQASNLMTVKERLRLHLWTYGLSEPQQTVKKERVRERPMPEELERALRKI